MRSSTRTFGALAFAAGMLLSAPAVTAHADSGAGGGQAVFVQTNDPTANTIAVFDRGPDGRLTFSAAYPTGGRGGRELGSMTDPLASQGSLVLDPSDSVLMNVNAGSNSVSVFGVSGDRLELDQTISSGGSFPTSIASHGHLIYVLNAALGGSVSGYRLVGGRLQPIPGSVRPLGLPTGPMPFFLSSPAQVGFTPDGRQLIVTTKTNSTVDVFSVLPDGTLSAQPVRNAEAPVPFAFMFVPSDQFDLVNAGNSSVAPFHVNDDGTIAPVGAQASDGQAAACWIVSAREFAYVANTGSGDISQFRINNGTVTLVNPAAASVPGAIDMSAAESGRFLYAESGMNGSVEVFAIGPDGSLTLVQNQPVPDGTNLEGIAAG